MPACRPCRASFFAPGERVRLPKGEVVVKPPSAQVRLVHNALPTPAPPASTPLRCRTRAAPCWSSPTTRRVEDGETALVFLGGEQSHAFTKGPILPPAGQRPVFDPSGHLCRGVADRLPIPTSNCGMSAMPRWMLRPPI